MKKLFFTALPFFVIFIDVKAQSLDEDCVDINPDELEVKKVEGTWKLVEGDHWVIDFGDKKEEAKQTLFLFRHYEMTKYCYVGRPDPSFEYLLSDGNSPEGKLEEDEDCLAFNPENIAVEKADGSWKIVEDQDHWMFDFGQNKKQARKAYKIIQKYGFTQSCFVGRPDASFHYMKQEEN